MVWKGFTWFFKTCFNSKLSRKHTVARVAHTQCIVLVVKCEVTSELQNKTNSVPLKRNAQGCTDRARGNPPWHRGGGAITWLNAEWRKCWDVQKKKTVKKHLKENNLPTRFALVSASSPVVCFSHYLQRCISKGDEEIRMRQHLTCGFSKKRLEKYRDYGLSRASGMGWLCG